VFCGTFADTFLRVKLPRPYLDEDAKDAIKLALVVIVMMSALVLSLLVSSAKSSYDLKRTQLTQIAADVIQIDRFLALYGSEANGARNALRDLVTDLADQIQSFRADQSKRESRNVRSGAKNLYQTLEALSPRDEKQKSLKAQALGAGFEVARIGALAQQSTSIPLAFLLILVFWLVVLFAGFGLFAPLNLATVTAFAICNFSVSAAIFLILQMDQPFIGLMRISVEPLRDALEAIGR
jgi:hypothetical protein